MLSATEFSSGRHSWNVRGTGWGAAVTGIALREVDRNGLVGEKDTVRVFGGADNISSIPFRKQVPGLTDDSVLTLTLDIPAGTFEVAMDGVPKPELTFSEGIVGKAWIPVAGTNNSGSSVTSARCSSASRTRSSPSSPTAASSRSSTAPSSTGTTSGARPTPAAAARARPTPSGTSDPTSS